MNLDHNAFTLAAFLASIPLIAHEHMERHELTIQITEGTNGLQEGNF